MNNLFTDRVVIVTGGGKGIGAGIVEAFRANGATVIVADIDPVDDPDFIMTDVASPESARQLVDGVVKKYGRLDVLVNNAGVYPFVNVDQMSEEDWDTVLHTNLRGLHLLCQEALKVLPEGGRIINISSIAGRVGFPGLAHYCASKAGVDGYTRALALEVAAKKITVNAIAPGAIDTPGAAGTEESRKETVKNIPLGRYGTPEDIAHAAVYLASEGASYVTGQVLVVDGGWTAH